MLMATFMGLTVIVPYRRWVWSIGLRQLMIYQGLAAENLA